MIRRLSDWWDHRTAYRRLVSALLIEDIPGGARWRYVWGSCLAFVFMIQLVTGVLLMAYYSPGDATAWSSVYFLQYHVDFGWLIRGLHHFGSQTMVILLALHMMQVVLAGAHLPPREVNWWLGLMLLGAVLGMGLTGYLLPWDQKGYWATQVATNIAGGVPVIGPFLQKMLIGGTSYGHHTLTRFFTLHVAILPGIIIVLIVLHLAAFRRHGVTPPPKAQGEGLFWPDQAFRDMVAGLIVFGLMLGLVVYGHAHPLEPIPSADGASATATTQPAEASTSLYDSMAQAGRRGLGANLDAPADASKPYPARPEWYFLFAFQLLKFFEGEHVLIGTVYIPAGIAAALFILPLLGYGRMRKFGHMMGIWLVGGLLVAVLALTVLALLADLNDSDLHAEFERASHDANRAIQLAQLGTPPGGAALLLHRDPQTRGPELFKQHCGACHNHSDVVTDADKASDLTTFGTKEWVMGILRTPRDAKYFGHTELTKMAEWVEENVVDLAESDWAELERIAEWLGTHPTTIPEDDDPFADAFEAFENSWECLDCHGFAGEGGSSKGPDFTGYGNADWIRGMIVAPDTRSRYGKDNAMTIFLDLDGPDAEVIKEQAADRHPGIANLPAVERELIIRWMTNNPRPVFGGDPLYSP